jgi:hypothetical protein
MYPFIMTGHLVGVIIRFLRYITHYLNITSSTAKVFAEAKNVEKSSSSGK